jgi:hypothetical protein
MEKNDKVYVITKGIYSDYHICAVTLDKSRAERLKKLLYENYEEATIEEYTLNEYKENGNVYYVEFHDDAPPTIGLDEYDGSYLYENVPCVLDWYDPIRVYVRAKDEQHAMKIAQDEYAKWKAEKEGVV